MDFLSIILDPNKFKSTCFVCYKQSKTILNVNEKVEIHVECFDVTCLPLATIIQKMFPAHDKSVGQICDNCTSLFIEMYVMLKKHQINKALFELIAKNLEEEIKVKYAQETNKCELKINVPKYKDIVNIQNEKVLETHTDNHLNENQKLFKCKTCDIMTFQSRDSLLKHNNISHRNVNDAVICEVCGKVCTSPTSLKSHLNCHKEIECPYCLKTLKTHSHYKIHIKNHNTRVKRLRTKKYYHCSNCNYKSLNKNSLEAHVNKNHLNIRPFTCNICFKSFYKKSNLTEHVNTHTNTGKAICEICGDEFLNKKSLIEHLRLHSDTRPYECEVCNKKFVTSGRRSDHFKRNHVEKNEQCQICGKRYSLKKDLTRHMKKMHTNMDNVVEEFVNQNLMNCYVNGSTETVLPIT